MLGYSMPSRVARPVGGEGRAVTCEMIPMPKDETRSSPEDAEDPITKRLEQLREGMFAAGRLSAGDIDAIADELLRLDSQDSSDGGSGS